MKLAQLLIYGNEGQSLSEYGLILAVLIVTVVLSLFIVGTKVSNLFANFYSEFP